MERSQSLHYPEINAKHVHRHANVRFCSMCIKSIPMNITAAHRVTFQRWCVSRIRSTKGYSCWGAKLSSDWPALGKPRRTLGPFPYTIQPIKIAKSNTFPSAQPAPALWLGDLRKSACKNLVQNPRPRRRRPNCDCHRDTHMECEVHFFHVHLHRLNIGTSITLLTQHFITRLSNSCFCRSAERRRDRSYTNTKQAAVPHSRCPHTRPKMSVLLKITTQQYRCV